MNYCRIIVENINFVAELLSNIMPTLSLTVLPAKALKDGRNKVRIAIAHNSQTRYIVTDVVVGPKQWKNGQVVKRDDAAYLNTKLRKKLNEVQRAIDDVPYIEGLSCPELIDTITGAREVKNRTLRSVFDEMQSVSTCKEYTKGCYECMFDSIARHIPEKTLVRKITPLMVRKYVKDRQSDLSTSSIQVHIRLLSKIINYCQQNGYTEFTILPTANCIKHTTVVRQNWITPDQVRFIRDYQGTKWCNKFRDLFMLSYYLGGINLIDLFKIDFRGLTTIKYVRSKTERCEKVNPFVEFDIPAEAFPIIARLTGDDGKIHCFKNGNHRWAVKLATNFRRLTGIEGLTMYSARKSFAQHAFQLGISESVIDYILGHSLNAGGKSIIYAYIKVTPAMATAAVRKVIDFINGNNNFD